MASMRFLVLEEAKDILYTFPRDEAFAMMEQHIEYMRNLVAKSKVVAASGFAFKEGGFAVFEVDSLQELNELIQGSPAGGVMKREVLPLTNLEDSAEITKRRRDLLQRVTAKTNP